MSATSDIQSKPSHAEILIAEDSPTQAEKLRYLLEEHGYSVIAVSNGRQALAEAHRRKPTLIVSDVVMPEMDGYMLCREIKRTEELKDIPVVLLTSLSDVRDIMQGLECGADNFIRKPYDNQYLISRISYLLMNLTLRKNQKMQMGMEIFLGGQKHFITAERQQILDLLISIYEDAIRLNNELHARQLELAHSNHLLNGLYRIAEGLNQAVTEREVCEKALEYAMELPGATSRMALPRKQQHFQAGCGAQCAPHIAGSANGRWTVPLSTPFPRRRVRPGYQHCRLQASRGTGSGPHQPELPCQRPVAEWQSKPGYSQSGGERKRSVQR